MRSKKFLTALLALVMALPFGLTTTPTPVAAQVVLPDAFYGAQGVGVTIGAVSTDVGILVKNVQSNGLGTVEVLAGGDVVLESVSGTPDTTTECPVSGALGGIIDVQDAACNTLGEVVDAINSSANWRAVIVDGVRSDNADNTLITLAETPAGTAKGVSVLKDTTIALNVSVAFAPFDRLDIRNYLSGSGTSAQLVPNPQADNRGILFFASGTFTGTGADTFEVISVKENNQRCSQTASAIVCSASEDKATVLSTIGGTTGVNKEYKSIVYGRKGEKLLVRLKAATTFTAAFLSANGLVHEFKAR